MRSFCGTRMLTFSNKTFRRTSCNSVSALVVNRFGFCTSPVNAGGGLSSTPEVSRRDDESKPARIAAPLSTSTACARCSMDVSTTTAYVRLSLRRGLSHALSLQTAHVSTTMCDEDIKSYSISCRCTYYGVSAAILQTRKSMISSFIARQDVANGSSFFTTHEASEKSLRQHAF